MGPWRHSIKCSSLSNRIYCSVCDLHTPQPVLFNYNKQLVQQSGMSPTESPEDFFFKWISSGNFTDTNTLFFQTRIFLAQADLKCSTGWLQIYSSPPASAFLTLRLQAQATT